MILQCGSDIRVSEHGEFAYAIQELSGGTWNTLCTCFDMRIAFHVAARLAAKDRDSLKDDPAFHAAILNILGSLKMTQEEAS